MKRQVLVVGITAVAIAAIYAGAHEPAPPRHLDADYCANRLKDLSQYKSGTTPTGAPLSEASTALDVKQCATQDSQFAAQAAPYLD